MTKPAILCVVLLIASGAVPGHAAQAPAGEEPISRPLYKPFIERYILDELKQLRQEQQGLRVEMADRVAAARLDASDRAIRYTADTVNNIFIIITAAVSILVLMGWRSLRDIKQRIEDVVEQKVSAVTREYESRLKQVEEKLRRRSEQIIAAQEEISRSNQKHSLWLRAGLESSIQEKLKIYDEIIRLHPDDLEAITYKADAVLELGEGEWAFELSNRAIELDDGYGLAYWQRACAEVTLGRVTEGLADIAAAIERSPSLRDELAEEEAFTGLRDHPEFQALMQGEPG